MEKKTVPKIQVKLGNTLNLVTSFVRDDSWWLLA